MKVEKNIDADQMHILEEVPAGAGESENEVVAVAPFLGKHLLEHQVQTGDECHCRSVFVFHFMHLVSVTPCTYLTKSNCDNLMSVVLHVSMVTITLCL